MKKFEKKCKIRLALLAGAAVFATGAAAGGAVARAETFDPSLHGLVLFELEDDWAYESDDEDSEVNTVTATIEPYFILSLTEGFAIETQLVFEQVEDPEAGEDTEFDNHGLYVESILASYTGDNFRVFAGKFGPTFGTAWDLAPGVYGTDFAEDYELSEKIGFGASYTLDGGEAGSHTLTANTFFADTTFLSGSTLHGRGDLEEEDGGISNTEDFSSYSVTLDSESVAGIEGLNTHLGYRSQSEGDADVDLDRETGYVVGANYTFPICDNVDATALVEWAGIRDSEGGDDDVDYYTGGLSFALYDNWNVALSHTSRNTDVQGGDDVDDHISQVSVGYAFDNGITLDVGYNHVEESDVGTDTVGALLGYVFEF